MYIFWRQKLFLILIQRACNMHDHLIGKYLHLLTRI